jgi:hypothetical protein
MDSFDDNSFSFSNLFPSNLFDNSYIMYGLIILILTAISYLGYKYYLNKAEFIGTTDIEYLQNTDENKVHNNNENQEVYEQNYE